VPSSFLVVSDPTAFSGTTSLLVMGRGHRLRSPQGRAAIPASVGDAAIEAMISGDPGDGGRVATTFAGDPVARVTLGVLPEVCSRHNAPSRAVAIPGVVRAAPRGGRLDVIALIDGPEHAFATAIAVAQTVPVFHATSRDPVRDVRLCLVAPDGPITDLAPIQAACDAVRDCAGWVDEPPDRMNPDRLLAVAREIAASLPGVHVHAVVGDDLARQGLGGLFGVGRASLFAPALVVLDWAPPGATGSAAWVGKGITYDTGGLSIKTKTGMPGMKSDMAGAAAVLAAFAAAVRCGVKTRLTAVLCIAENAVGPRAIRPDDVLVMASGRTVEVNNTDAEGRLVLADGVAWVSRNRRPDTIIDLATLTGAQTMTTGRRVAAIYANDEGLERRAVLAGRASGDLVHPLPYFPELYRAEFHSPVADLRNSVKDRDNAQSACAAQFIAQNLVDHVGGWLHVDICGPATAANRGTGFGVGLLLTLAGVGAPVERA
jgi:probable aminopeptidase NPEPL1